MDLSEADADALREVEKRERRWRRGRWLNVAASVILLITGFDLLRLGGVDGQALLGSKDAAAAYRAFQDATMAILGILANGRFRQSRHYPIKMERRSTEQIAHQPYEQREAGPAVNRPPNPRLQRTPSASPPSPLSRKPFGD